MEELPWKINYDDQGNPLCYYFETYNLVASVYRTKHGWAYIVQPSSIFGYRPDDIDEEQRKLERHCYKLKQELNANYRNKTRQWE